MRSILLFAFWVGACSAPDPVETLPAGEAPLVAVSNMRHPPFSSWSADGHAAGIEIDLVAAAAAQLGREVEWVERPFGELLTAVASGEADVAGATIGITPAREELVLFSTSYYQTSIVALVRPGTNEPKTLAQLDGLRIATERGTTAIDAVATRVPTAERVLDRAGEMSWAQMLVVGEIDAIVLDESHAETFMEEAGTRFHQIDEPLKEERFALAVHPEATELRAALDAAVAEYLAANDR